MKKTILSILTVTILSFGAIAQNVNIPDANFKTYLLGNAAINTDADPNEISVIEAQVFNATIDCSSLVISDLTGIEAFINLIALKCNNNNLTSLDVSSNTSLTSLECYLNNITSIDVSQHPVINSVTVYNNDLTSLNVANGNNSVNDQMSFVNNPNLLCIQVDPGFTPPPNGANNWYKDATASYSDNCGVTPCTVTIPDANFKGYLVGNAAINTNGDTEIQCTEASAFAGAIFANSLAISDLTGVEAFTSLGGLHCNDNNITTIDISANTLLQALQCNENQISSISTVNNPILVAIYCHSNLLTSLDLSSNPDLQIIRCYNNQISTLSLPQSATLDELIASDNNLTAIDVTFNTGLSSISVEQNQLSTIDLSQNTQLESLYLRNNLLVSLDCSSNPVLDWIVANDNPNMQTIDVSNGNNTNFGFFRAHNSPNLTCIQVDDVAYSTTNWTGSSFMFDAASSFSLNCTVTVLVNSIVVQGIAGASAITTQGGTLQMEATVLPANADDATYTWSAVNGTGTASVNASGLLTALTNGTVDVIATANDGSGVTGSVTITITNQDLGLNESVQEMLVKVYPNPVQNELFVQLDNGQITQMDILDLSGKVIKTITNSNAKSIDVSILTQGVYMLKVYTETGVSNNRFVKQ